MAKIVIIAGKTGCGKSTGIKTLNPEETCIFNILGKDLPFKGSRKIYSSENKNIINFDANTFKHEEFLNYLKAIGNNNKYKNIVIDDCIYTIRNEFFKRSKEQGYNKFTDMGKNFQEIITTCQSIREDVTVFLLMHTEDVSDGDQIVGTKISTIGKLLDEKYDISGVVSVMLIAEPKVSDTGEIQYGYYTRKTYIGKREIPAKSPHEMFEEQFIPNDFKYIIDKMNEYYELY